MNEASAADVTKLTADPPYVFGAYTQSHADRVEHPCSLCGAPGAHFCVGSRAVRASGACKRCGGACVIPGPNGLEIDCPDCCGSAHQKRPRGERKGQRPAA